MTSDLGEGDVLVKVAYSSVNYKDALAASGKKGQVARISPLVPGIDLRPARTARRCSRTATTSASPTTAATPSTRGCRPTGSSRCRTG